MFFTVMCKVTNSKLQCSTSGRKSSQKTISESNGGVGTVGEFGKVEVTSVYRCFCGKLTEPVREKTNNLVFRPGLTQTGLYSHRSRLEA